MPLDILVPVLMESQLLRGVRRMTIPDVHSPGRFVEIRSLENLYPMIRQHSFTGVMSSPRRFFETMLCALHVPYNDLILGLRTELTPSRRHCLVLRWVEFEGGDCCGLPANGNHVSLPVSLRISRLDWEETRTNEGFTALGLLAGSPTGDSVNLLRRGVVLASSLLFIELKLEVGDGVRPPFISH